MEDLTAISKKATTAANQVAKLTGNKNIEGYIHLFNRTVDNVKYIKASWDKLYQSHQVKREIANLKYNGDEEVDTFMNKFNKLINELKNSDSSINTEKVVSLLLESLKGDYANINERDDIHKNLNSTDEIVLLIKGIRANKKQA